jgi:hypothetical protein
MDPTSRVVGAVVVIAIVGGVAFWWRQQQRPVPPPPPPAKTAPVVAPTPPARPDASTAPAIRHPIGADSSGADLPTLDKADAAFNRALVDLLGRKAVASFFNIDGFTNRVVATVDNLAREGAAAELWPVRPVPGGFDTEPVAGGTAISDRNAHRYAAMVRMVEAFNTRRAVALYVRFYPLLQRAYEEIGYPGKYFNDRVVEVIDHLLATPEIPAAIMVKRVALTAPTANTGTPSPVGGLYQYQDPTLEARSAGQKIMLRVGPANARKLKAKLVDIRQQIAKVTPAH